MMHELCAGKPACVVFHKHNVDTTAALKPEHLRNLISEACVIVWSLFNCRQYYKQPDGPILVSYFF